MQTKVHIPVERRTDAVFTAKIERNFVDSLSVTLIPYTRIGDWGEAWAKAKARGANGMGGSGYDYILDNPQGTEARNLNLRIEEISTGTGRVLDIPHLLIRQNSGENMESVLERALVQRYAKNQLQRALLRNDHKN